MKEKGGTRTQHPIPAVRLIVKDERQRVLILKRARTSHGTGEWCLPGGNVDYGETVQEAAEKELWEETSLVCTSPAFLFYQDSLPDNPGGMHCINFYLECEAEGTVVLNEESSEYAWVDPETLHNYHLVFRNGEGLLRYWKDSLTDNR